MENIIVSAFITNVNNTLSRDLNFYINNGILLLNIPINKIIFIEKEIYEKYFENKHFPYVKFIMFNKYDNYLYHYKDKITNFNAISDNINKNTIEYMFVQCHKTEWVKLAIETKLYDNVNNYIWIDFSIFHIAHNIEDFKYAIINQLKNKIYDNIRIASGWNLDINYNVNPYNDIMWYFLGGLFGGSPNNLLLFADLMKNKCIQIINNYNTLPWEVNIWWLIFNENKELFNSYHGDHNLSMIKNY